MRQDFNRLEMAIVVSIQEYNPLVLTSDFLKYSGIVPADLELAEAPILSEGLAQVSFENGVSIIGQPNRILFSEALIEKDLNTVSIPSIAYRYINALTQLDCQSIGINFRAYVPAQGSGEFGYLFSTLLTSGSWHKFAGAQAQALLRLVYPLEDKQLTLDINEATLNQSEHTALPIVLFSANFHYPLTGETAIERATALTSIVQNWRTDQLAYEEFLSAKFLPQEPQLAIPIATASFQPLEVSIVN